MKTGQNTKTLKRRFTIILLVLVVHASLLKAQVGIDVSAPEPATVLDLSTPGKDRGLLIPRMSSAQREAIVNPVDGLLVYDETLKAFYFYKTTSTTAETNDKNKWQAVNPFSYRKGSGAIDEDHFVLQLTNSKSVVIGNVASPTETFEVGGTAKVTGTVHATQDVSTDAHFVGYGTIPVGGIIMWSGSLASIPDGWALCNGQTSNSIVTPNLSGRFIVGVGQAGAGPANYAVGNTGGEERHTLTVAEMPSHNHGGATSTDGAHTHDYERPDNYEGYQALYNHDPEVFVYHNATYATTSAGAHAHTISAQGGGQSHENRPPFFALAYLMRVK